MPLLFCGKICVLRLGVSSLLLFWEGRHTFVVCLIIFVEFGWWPWCYEAARSANTPADRSKRATQLSPGAALPALCLLSSGRLDLLLVLGRLDLLLVPGRLLLAECRDGF